MSPDEDSKQTSANPGAVIQPGTQPDSGNPAMPPVAVAGVPTGLAPAQPQVSPQAAPDLPAPSKAPSRLIETPSNSVQWTASEFIAHHKDHSWYLGLAVVTILGAVSLYFFTKDVMTPAVVAVAAIIFGVYASHEPRQIQYELSEHGITVGPRHFDYDNFRSFSIVPDHAFSSIVLMPLKRFAPPLSLYYAPDDEETIANILSDMLPYEPRQPDMTDRMLRKIRF